MFYLFLFNIFELTMWSRRKSNKAHLLHLRAKTGFLHLADLAAGKAPLRSQNHRKKEWFYTLPLWLTETQWKQHETTWNDIPWDNLESPSWSSCWSSLIRWPKARGQHGDVEVDVAQGSLRSVSAWLQKGLPPQKNVFPRWVSSRNGGLFQGQFSSSDQFFGLTWSHFPPHLALWQLVAVIPWGKFAAGRNLPTEPTQGEWLEVLLRVKRQR